MIVGLDTPPGQVMTDAELDALADPFAVLALRRGERPQSVDAVVALLAAASARPEFAASAVPERLSFVVGEGGQIPFTDATGRLARALRFVVVLRGAAGPDGPPVVMISLDDRPGAGDGLLQILGWDPEKRAYNFYQRRQGVWFHSGDGTRALNPPTRMTGPFDGHVNGSLVMKELRQPWLHWQSQTVGIAREAFAPGHPIVNHPFFTEARGAEILETQVIVPGIRRWTKARLDSAVNGGRIRGARTLFRQVVETTTVNLVASPTEFSLIDDTTAVTVPLEIHLNREFWTAADILDPLAIRGRTTVPGALYRVAVAELGVELREQRSGFARPGDSFFVLACPAPAFEDLDVIMTLIERGVLSRRFARALLAVDFANPIQSARRATLLRHFPDEGAAGTGDGSVEAAALASMAAAAAGSPGSVEAEVVARMEGDEAASRTALGEELAAYVAAVRARLATPEGAHDLVRLVASRRRYFRTLGVSEFDLTLPFSSEPEDADPLEMVADGTVRAAPNLIS
ncbi:hypothetical protein [Acuticoccus sediminis]|uniref:hypothetical protein n=1 Tax=Acuticoccus sediminis TaxID=2184697 RepID=UPI001CFD1FF4|nr:hypothetical protein [Acuticoccus sediminis]